MDATKMLDQAARGFGGEEEAATEGSATINAAMPLFRAWRSRFRNPLTGDVLEVDFIWMLATGWPGSPWSAEGGWRARRIGPFVLALRPLF